MADDSDLVKYLTNAAVGKFSAWDAITMQPLLYGSQLYEKDHKLVTEYILDQIEAADQVPHRVLRLIGMISQSSHGLHSSDLDLIRQQLTHTFGIDAAASLANLEMLGIIKPRMQPLQIQPLCPMLHLRFRRSP